MAHRVAGSLLPILAGYARTTRTNGESQPFNARDETLDQVVSLRNKFTDVRTFVLAK